MIKDRQQRPVVYLEVWRDTLDFEKVMAECRKHKNSDIIVDCVKENTLYSNPNKWPTKSRPNNPSFTDAILDCKDWNCTRGNKLIIILGNYKPNAEEHHPDDMLWDNYLHPERLPSTRFSHFDHSVQLGLWDKIEIWPSYFFVWNGFKISKHAFMRQPFKVLPDGFDNLFILKIRQAKPHRLLLLDEMEKRNLLKEGVYTCVDPANVLDTNLEKIGATTYSGGVREGNATNTNNIYADPHPLTDTAFMEIVSETSISSHFYTEKTVWPIAYSKPFLIHGTQYQNHDLKKLGFVLYDEIFDYTFDTIAAPRKRTEALAEEILRLKNMNLDLVDVYEQLRPKLEHNLRRLIELCNYDEYMPDTVLQFGEKVIIEQLKKCSTYENHGTIPVDPELGNWLPMLDKPRCNQHAMAIVRDRPYLSRLFYNGI